MICSLLIWAEMTGLVIAGGVEMIDLVQNILFLALTLSYVFFVRNCLMYLCSHGDARQAEMYKLRLLWNFFGLCVLSVGIFITLWMEGNTFSTFATLKIILFVLFLGMIGITAISFFVITKYNEKSKWKWLKIIHNIPVITFILTFVVHYCLMFSLTYLWLWGMLTVF